MGTDLARLIQKAKRRRRRLTTAAKAQALAPEPGPRRERWGAKSRFRGVYPTPLGRWAAKVRVAGRLHYVGTYDDDEAAARAFDRKARELLGGAARLNFPVPEEA